MRNREAIDLPPRSTHLRNNGNADKRSAYRVGVEDAWPPQPKNHPGLREDRTQQARRGYVEVVNQAPKCWVITLLYLTLLGPAIAEPSIFLSVT